MDVATLTVKGCLRWDVEKEGLELRAGYVLVDGDGYLEVGTARAPMNKRATIFLKEGQHHPRRGTRFLWGQGSSRVQIHGRTLGRSWTLLARTASEGATELHLKHDAQGLGWRVGDTIGIATTSRRPTRPYTITSVRNSGIIKVEPPLVDEHMGGMRRITVTGSSGTFDHEFELAAEVVNLQRSVVITGEPNWDTPSRQGLHTGMSSSGFIDVRYTRVENCGQPPNVGRYCLHFHHMHDCPRCVFQGNAIVNSTQVGITIHGTHRSLVDRNVLWNTAAVGIYVEDGNEMNNTVSENAVICMHRVPLEGIGPNTPPENCQQDLFNEPGRIGGIYVLGMTNHFIGNRVVNMENGFWFKGSADPKARGSAAGRICPQHLPFGKISGNVCHDNRRFGMYPDNQLPRNVRRDENGLLPKKADGSTDWSSCEELTPDGHDNGVQPANVIEDQLDYHNMFVGQYILGDVEYRRYTGINNGHCMYWKSSKNFADGKSYHMRDSLCVTDWTDPVFQHSVRVRPSGQLFGPAGAFTFRMRNMTFVGDAGGMGALIAGQHCMQPGAGGPCNVQYLLEGVDFSALPVGSRHLNFGAHAKAPGEVLPVFLAKDSSLGGFRAVVSRHLDGFEQEGCVPLGSAFDHGLGCHFPVRRLNIWTKDLGPMRIVGPGYEVAANPDSPTLRGNAGFLQYAQDFNGYGALVIPGKTYTLETDFAPGMRVDFSEWYLPQFFGNLQESVWLRTTLGECFVYAKSSLHYGRFGPDASASTGECHAALGGDLQPEPEVLGTCHTAVPTDECFRHVEWAMKQGIHAHPHTYVGLAANSSFEDFQDFLHRNKHGNCPRPCPLCHTAVQGEECYGHVVWAMQYGIRGNPDAYLGLTASSSFEDFQALLNRIEHGKCQPPCPQVQENSKACHTATVGEECHRHVEWAKTFGIKFNPHVYKGLTATSTFEDFQAFLHRDEHGNCPEPCPARQQTALEAEEHATQRTTWKRAAEGAGRPLERRPAGRAEERSEVHTDRRPAERAEHRPEERAGACHTARLGEECFAHVEKAVAALVRQHPRRSAGALAGELFEELQASMHAQGLGGCPRPCARAGAAVRVRDGFELLSRPAAGAAWPAPLTGLLVAGLFAVLLLPPSFVAVQRLRTRLTWSQLPLTATRVRTGHLSRGERPTCSRE